MASSHEILALFDLDGTLLTAADPEHRAAFQHALRTVFGVNTTFDGLRLGGRQDLSLAIEVLNRSGVPVTGGDPRLDDVMAIMGRYYELRVGPGDRASAVLTGVGDLLRRLRAGGIATAVGTGSARVVAQRKLASSGIADFFPAGAYGDEETHRPDLLRRAVRQANGHYGRPFLVANTVVIGDTPSDVAAARQVGARIIAVATGRYSVEELDELGPDAVFSDLSNVDAVVRSVQG